MICVQDHNVYHTDWCKLLTLNWRKFLKNVGKFPKL